MGSIALKFACVVLACIVVSAPSAEAAITCGTVVSKLLPCLNYLRSGGPVPPPCCSGVKGLNAAAKTTPDRQAACNCLKQAAGSYSVNPAYAAALPGACGVTVPFKISPSTDCTKVK